MLSGFEIYLWPVPVMIHFSPITDPPQKFPVASFSEIRAIHGNSFGRAVAPLYTLKFSFNSQGPEVSELAHQGCFQLSFSVSCMTKR